MGRHTPLRLPTTVIAMARPTFLNLTDIILESNARDVEQEQPGFFARSAEGQSPKVGGITDSEISLYRFSG